MLSKLTLSGSPNRVLPGFKLSMAITILWLSILVILPLGMIVLTSLQLTGAEIIRILTSKRVLSSLRVTFSMAFLAIAVNCIFGVLVAWVLGKYEFKGKHILNSLIDIPFAVPTAISGIALATVYAPNGWIGQLFTVDGLIGKYVGAVKIAYSPVGIWLALIFISLPFIVRSIQPILENLDKEIEEAALTLGASRTTTFFKVILPNLYPALISGASMGFARATGEYGSVIFIAGNIPFVSEIAPVLIIAKLEQFDTAGASVIALMMLSISLVFLLISNFIQKKLTIPSQDN